MLAGVFRGKETKVPAAEDPSQIVSRVVAKIRRMFAFRIQPFRGLHVTSCHIVSRAISQCGV
eukprot:1183715-Prorocentrum_minimum.AAC.2